MHCEKSCPYGQPSVDQDNGYSTKCDLCRLLIDKGENPACVDACATRALHYGDIEELKKQYGSVTYLPPLPENDETGPSIVFTPSR
ncbi:4Fe-4S dicluster domain-containing protein, partial [Gordonibacter sp.]|uniref:4Fe-4S dicluster domain-containing protein n=1 Tax=Gordonibacter sp. TaxID=1968902 RepID=UPI003FA58BFE